MRCFRKKTMIFSPPISLKNEQNKIDWDYRRDLSLTQRIILGVIHLLDGKRPRESSRNKVAVNLT